MSGILILGAGGHAKVVADILTCQGRYVIGFLDDDPALWGSSSLGLPILGGTQAYVDYAPDGLVIGIGRNQRRQAVVERLGPDADRLWVNAVHPGAIIASSVRLGKGVAVMAGAIINPEAVIGDHAIINTGATVDHDCQIGAFCHIAPGTHLAGNVRIGEGAIVGIGSSAIPGCVVGDWSVIGAGAVIVRDIPGGVTAKGVPARWNKE
jgi:sugar O-acyltransferase (sialic acid O-acetyltransferase NeuD family)